MTLVCECGGHPVCQGGSKTDGVVHETYECPECGRRGTYLNDLGVRGDARLSGCLTSR
jgi:hypothetical protein